MHNEGGENMNKEIYNLAEWSLKTAKSAGADNCRVGINSNRLVEISYRDRKPENIKEASTRGFFIDVYVNGRYSSQSTSDLRKDELKKFIANAVATTKLLAEDPFRTLPDSKYYKGRAEVDLKICDKDYDSFSPEKRHEIAKTIEESCLAKGGDKIISVISSEQDSRAESITLTSNGFEGSSESTYYSAGARVTAQDEGDRRPNGYNYVTSVSQKDLPSAQNIGEVAAERTLALLGGKKIKTEKLPIILENRNVPRLLGGLLEAMSGRNIQQKQSFLSDKKGQQIAGDVLTIIDDPFIPGGLGSQLFDGDGFAAKKRTMIDNGVLKDFYINWYYSRKLECEPTTGGSSNLVIPQGKRSVEAIMKDLGRGIFITGFIGGNSNSTTGDASIGIIGKLFDGGVPVQTIAEMNIADNHLEFWKRLVEAANDPWVYSSYRTPSLVFENVVVSGV